VERADVAPEETQPSARPRQTLADGPTDIARGAGDDGGVTDQTLLGHGIAFRSALDSGIALGGTPLR
jgi:hypothetical protein